MKSTRVLYYSLAAFLGALALASTTQAQEGVAIEERAIRALFERVNLASNADTPEKGVEIMRGVLSEKGFTIVLSNRRTTEPGKMAEAFVGDKKALCEVLAQSIRNGPRWGVHTVKQVTIADTIAYEIGETKEPNQDTQAPSMTWLNVLAKEDVGWRIVYATPADDFLKALRQLDAGKGKPAK